MAFALNLRGQPPIKVEYKNKIWTIAKVEIFVLRPVPLLYALGFEKFKAHKKGKLKFKYPLYKNWDSGHYYLGVLDWCGCGIISTSSASARKAGYHSPLETLYYFLWLKKKNTTLQQIEKAIKRAIKKGDFRKLRRRYTIALGVCSDSNLRREKTNLKSKWVFFNPLNFSLPPLHEGDEDSNW